MWNEYYVNPVLPPPKPALDTTVYRPIFLLSRNGFRPFSPALVGLGMVPCPGRPRLAPRGAPLRPFFRAAWPTASRRTGRFGWTANPAEGRKNNPQKGQGDPIT